ncbi:proteasome assembly chaperone 1-like [Ptychodera flava]|uniref:proteasome assembly chaperone 1-like n=1 Tax=Ptychodera flava TaxID=63121 RepID=UPI003969CFE7
MATFFGEIVTTSSRVDADDDEEEDEKAEIVSPVLRWSPDVRAEIGLSKDEILSCDNLLLAIGPAATGFVHTYVLGQEHEVIGVVVSGLKNKDSNSFHQTMHTDKTCFLYRLKSQPKTLVCQCNCQVSAEQAFSWTEQLFRNLKNPSVTILGSCQITEYKSHDPIQAPPFIKCLCSSEFKDKPVCAYLPQPNTVSELAAAVLNCCQVRGMPAVLYMAYLDSVHLEIASMKVFLPVLNNPQLKNILKVNTDAEITMKKLVELDTTQNPLYI